MTIYSRLAETLQYINPNFYKRRFFKKQVALKQTNLLERNIEPELFWIQSFLSSDDVFMDVGANVGAYLYALEGIVPAPQTYAFEPSKKLSRRLRRIFPGCHVFPIALSDKNEQAALTTPKINGEKIRSRSTLRNDLTEKNQDGSSEESVKVIRLDDWAYLEHLHRLSFIKIDVEGNERNVIQGAKKTIARFRPTLMIEIEQRHHQIPVWQVVEEICLLGYKPFYLNRTTLTLSPLTEKFLGEQNEGEVKNYAQYINNIIFTPEK